MEIGSDGSDRYKDPTFHSLFILENTLFYLVSILLRMCTPLLYEDYLVKHINISRSKLPKTGYDHKKLLPQTHEFRRSICKIISRLMTTLVLWR